jgi:hypothetical protein
VKKESIYFDSILTEGSEEVSWNLQTATEKNSGIIAYM